MAAGNTNYGIRKSQVRKEDLYMMTALWMQESPWALKLATEGENLRVVGSVFVLPNDRVLSVDCSRRRDHTTVHGAIRPLIKYPDKVKGCQVYLTRKPCAHCVKMLVQAGVSKVFYLPLKPEKTDTKENKSVDALFQVSEVSRSFYVPQITPKHIHDLKTEIKPPPYGRNEIDVENTREDTDLSIFEEYKERKEWDETWIAKIRDDLGWDEFGDKGIETEVRKDMDDAFKWFCQATFAVGKRDNNIWKRYGKGPNDIEQDVAEHLSRLAQMLSNRADDPNRSVGCVIAIGEEIVSIGWNGFPSKALYGNHPRGSDSDKAVGQKYPHVIHAEQNALLCRNERKLEGSIVYVNKIPCNDCMSMLYELGVRKVVLPHFDVPPPAEGKDSETCFFKLVENPAMEVYRHQLIE
ncbi:hypothetical protein QZH41_005031 [Actinostola sp. cb2023]|nr:hypothetical protein QZH41_005031 [Actinostola sp. cb2023]